MMMIIKYDKYYKYENFYETNFSDIDERIKDDKEFVLKTLKYYPLSLQYFASKRLHEELKK